MKKRESLLSESIKAGDDLRKILVPRKRHLLYYYIGRILPLEWLLKFLMSRWTKQSRLEYKIKDLQNEVKAYEAICKQYAGYFEARESLIILSKIENKLNNGEL